MVITHSPSDYMLDHEETARIVRGAVFAAPIPLYKTRATTPKPPMSATPALYYADTVLAGDQPEDKQTGPPA